MIDKKKLTEVVQNDIDGTDLFLVDITVSPDNRITVEIDSPDSVDIDTCIRLTRTVEQAFDRDVEDYELEVGSAGLTSPFKVIGQYAKNIGNEVDVLTRDGQKLHGILDSASPADDDDNDIDFTILVDRKVKEPGKKKPVIIQEPVTLKASRCKSVAYHISFK